MPDHDLWPMQGVEASFVCIPGCRAHDTFWYVAFPWTAQHFRICSCAWWPVQKCLRGHSLSVYSWLWNQWSNLRCCPPLQSHSTAFCDQPVQCTLWRLQEIVRGINPKPVFQLTSLWSKVNFRQSFDDGCRACSARSKKVLLLSARSFLSWSAKRLLLALCKRWSESVCSASAMNPQSVLCAMPNLEM